MKIQNYVNNMIMKRRYKLKHILIMDNVRIDSTCNIGDYTYIGQNTSITKTDIGRYCSIGSDVIVGPGEHSMNSISTSSHFLDSEPYEIFTAKKLRIGHDVWIGTKAVILRGVEIGNGAVIGAGAVVTKNVPAFAVVVGVPARIVKYRFNAEKIAEIENSKWWEYNLSEARIIQSQLMRD